VENRQRRDRSEARLASNRPTGAGTEALYRSREGAAVLRVAIRNVLPDKVDRLRDWMLEVDGPRRREAIATLVDEGCRSERAYLIDGARGPVLVYVMDVEDVAQSEIAASRSSHPIDADHKAVLTETLGDHVPAELLLDLVANE
jgi:Family of unknown function (DUF6176)